MTTPEAPVDLSVGIGRLRARNPVMLASGTAGYGPELAGLLDLGGLGGLVTKGISLLPWEGNPPPRIAELPHGMLNAIGLQNVGLDAFLRDKVPFLRELRAAGTLVAANVAGRTVDEYAAVARGMRGCGALDAIELNISCPNVRCGGMAFGTDPVAAAEVTCATVEAADLPVWVKLSPNATDVAAIGKACERAGASALVVANTLLGLAVDLERRRPRLSIGAGGYSGPAVKPVALRMVRQVARACGIPVIGVGGVGSARDALEFMVCGAAAVQIGTATFGDPGVAAAIVAGMADWCREHGIARVADLVGTLEG